MEVLNAGLGPKIESAFRIENMPYSHTLQNRLLPHRPPPSSSSSSSSSSAPATTTSMIDGTWEISVYIDDLDLKKIRVRGDLHVGGLMLKIVEGLENDRDWSDYAIWWPKKNSWLTRTRSTLDQLNVQAGSLLHFQPVHSSLYVQLPDLQIVQMRVDFSADLFSVVIRMCRQLGIRHPEELSLSLPLEKEDLKRKDQGLPKVQRSKSHYDVLNSDLNGGRSTSRDSLTSAASSHFHRASNQSLQQNPSSSSAFLRDSFYGNRDSGRFSLRRKKKSGTLKRTISSPLSPAFADGTLLPRSAYDAGATSDYIRASTGSLYPPPSYDIVNSPWVSAREAFEVLLRPKNLAEKARCNAGWLNSSKSLMEQSVLPSSLVLLKFKFYAFYDINPLHDSVRINQLYEQAKWSILTEEMECTREEMAVFAALQLHVHRLQNPTSPDRLDSTLDSTLRAHDYDLCRTPEDIIEAALNDLQMSLEGSTLNYPAPFSARSRYGTVDSSSSSNSNSYSTMRRSPFVLANGVPSANSAYSIANSSSSSSPPFYPTLTRGSRYNFDGVYGIGPAPNQPLPSPVRDITQVPELKGCLRFYRPKRFFLKSYKKQPFMFKDLTLAMFRTVNDEKPIWSLDLQGCDVTSDVLLSGRKYIIKLMVPMSRGADEIWFKMDDEEQYVNWLAGMKLACRGRTMADVPSFQAELADIQGKMSLLRGGRGADGRETSVRADGDGHYSLVSTDNNGSNNRRNIVAVTNGTIDNRNHGNSGNINNVNNNSNISNSNNGYDFIGPRPTPPTTDFPASTLAGTTASNGNTVSRDSRRRSFLGKFKASREADDSGLDVVDGTILRSRSKSREGQPTRNGGSGSSRPINGGHGEGEEEPFRARSVSSSDSVTSIPKSMKDGKGTLFGRMAPSDFLAPRFCRRSKLKQMLNKISEAVAEMRHATALESKLAFIKAWQSLPDFGHSYFVIRIKGSKREDILALTPVKIVLMDGGSHEVLKRWRYQELRSWSVNWEVKQVMIEFEEDEMTFRCLSSDCKVIHEYLGGYIFLSMRSPEQNHRLNQELFHKLTGGWT